MKEVLKRGHKNIAIITLEGAAYIESNGIVAPGVANFRSIGYKRALEEYGVTTPIMQYHENSTLEGGRKACSKIIKDSLPSAVVTMSDIQALGVIEELEKRGYRVPTDVCVVGFDSIFSKSQYNHTFTTINQNGYLKGEEVAKMLFKIINGAKIENKNFLIPLSFIEGETLKSV